MIELASDVLNFTFPEVHPEAELQISFQRTLRIPDDANDYPLPPGLGAFPIQHVDDHAASVPSSWLQHGGVMLPMFQSEAMWLDFDSSWIEQNDVAYPFAIKVAAGKQCAISGEPWKEGVTGKPQNYMVAPEQPWLDGFVVEKGCIRQFVAMPLGSGYSAEEQITGAAQHGGVGQGPQPGARPHPGPRSGFPPRAGLSGTTRSSSRRSRTGRGGSDRGRLRCRWWRRGPSCRSPWRPGVTA